MNDIVICTAAILLDPLAAFLVEGVGAFLEDLFFISAADVCVAHNAWPAFLALCASKAPRAGVWHRRGHWRRDHGGRLFAGQGFYLQHAGVCLAEAALSNFAGGRRRGDWHGPFWEIQAGQSLYPENPEACVIISCKSIMRSGKIWAIEFVLKNCAFVSGKTQRKRCGIRTRLFPALAARAAIRWKRSFARGSRRRLVQSIKNYFFATIYILLRMQQSFHCNTHIRKPYSRRFYFWLHSWDISQRYTVPA